MPVRRLHKRPVGLDVTAFINLIVVLVPFLLSTAVFSRLAVLNLTLPAQSTSFGNLKGDLQLEVVIRPEALVVQDRIGGKIMDIPKTAAGHDFRGLSQLMEELKTRFPDKTEASILAEPDTPYDVLVQVMDAVREGRVAQGANVVTADFFPDISIGDAPIRTTGAGS
ncbi:MAG TPA: biopolymer transporter ExbD [Burkholderiaceae bacterium]|jgi:biopolymer transport protein ExbD|nr:biopolymer transporter ExbD [Burkholderiaceae bacterium]